jgi:hypothetical protein
MMISATPKVEDPLPMLLMVSSMFPMPPWVTTVCEEPPTKARLSDALLSQHRACQLFKLVWDEAEYFQLLPVCPSFDSAVAP